MNAKLKSIAIAIALLGFASCTKENNASMPPNHPSGVLNPPSSSNAAPHGSTVNSATTQKIEPDPQGNPPGNSGGIGTSSEKKGVTP